MARYRPRRDGKAMSAQLFNEEATSESRFRKRNAIVDAIDEVMGFERYDAGSSRVGWLVNFQPTSQEVSQVPNGRSCVDFYFIDDEGGYFKTTIKYDPYFLLKCSPGSETAVEEFLRKDLELFLLKDVHYIEKEDLNLPNHLTGIRQPLLKLSFWNVQDLLGARKKLYSYVEQNQKRLEEDKFREESMPSNPANCILDIKEQDVPYHVRVTVDLNIRVGKWYTVRANGNSDVELSELPDRIERADPVVLAFDIETTKQPLKFPDKATDQIMMISYMIDGVGYLITNRELVSADIEDFEYTPKPEFPGYFTIFNEPNERSVIQRFFDHVREERPTVIATFNGDFFDWPFVDARASVWGISMYDEIGFRPDQEEEYKSSYCVHMDCYRWVKRDSYLPQGSQGLKAVTTAKLGYNPLELDPELMTPYAQELPQVLSEYSVSDAVATYYLYMKYVHPFIFSLCTILPLRPDEVLRKGTGTLCEMLLTVQAYEKNILLPHKHSDPLFRFYDGHLIESETYVGGHVESLEAGVFRADIPTSFNVGTSAVDELLEQLDSALKFTITVENELSLDDVLNYDQVKENIRTSLLSLKESPKRKEKPLIYHVDVASMYPNIMTTNRLQPDSMITEEDCALCDFNVPGKQCDRRLPWAWRGEFFPPKRDEYLMIERQLKQERFKNKTWDDLSLSEQSAAMKKRLGDYSRKIYHKLRDSETVEREAIVCQRENPFYVNTVRAFRDRRYEFKGLNKVWKRKLSDIPRSNTAEREAAGKMVVLYDSMQLAHKVILNSFYGYVMRKGSRWYSMEMAGVTCLTGATIIQLARSMVERLGRPLELDTDGIWCILPESFPGDYMFELRNGKKVPMAYPCAMLNYLVHKKFTNEQYHVVHEDGSFEITRDNTIWFEVDGPYRAMVMPSSREEGKGLKKRYAVFNFDGSLAELKGFELKRRGELSLIKSFQSQVFGRFLEGNTLEECYAAVAKVANAWLDICDTQGSTVEDADLMQLLSENKSMSKALSEYGGQKSTAICTAKRLGEFLGSQMVQDKGLVCRYIISSEPIHEPVASRAIPVAIFNAEASVKGFFLRKWLKQPGLDNFDPRTIIDWGYYRERLAATIQKIITIPAVRQRIPNPCTRVTNPVWLEKRILREAESAKQAKLGFAKTSKKDHLERMERDVEDIVSNGNVGSGVVRITKRQRGNRTVNDDETLAEILSVPDSQPPDPDVDYSAYLAHMKPLWRKRTVQRAQSQRIYRRQMGLRTISGDSEPTSWLILDAQPLSATKTQLAIWTHQQNLQKIIVNVMPKVFIETLHPRPHWIKATDWLLPNGRPSDHLYVVEGVEALEAEDMPEVHSVFESAIEPWHHAIIKLGQSCTLVPSPGRMARGLDQGFDIGWLKPMLSSERPDFDPPWVLLQHYQVHKVSVVAITSSWSPTVMFQSGGPPFLNNAEVVEARRLASKTCAVLNDLRSEKPSALALVDSVQPIRFQAALSSFVSLPAPKVDAAGLPTLNWHVTLERRMARAAASIPAFLKQRLSLAAFANVPLAKAEPVFSIDVLLARRLMEGRHLLWWNPVPPPQETDELPVPAKINPGLYTNVCLDIEVRELIINTILTASQLLSAEGVDPDTDVGGLAQGNFSAVAWSTLAAMAKDFWKSALGENTNAELLFAALSPWIASTQAFLYSTELKQLVHLLTTKSLNQLVSGIKRLGCESVAYASPSRLIAVTPKRQVENSLEYGAFIVKRLRTNPLFAHADFAVSNHWQYLVWRDPKNFCGNVRVTPGNMEHSAQWHLGASLPPFLSEELAEWIHQYMLRLDNGDSGALEYLEKPLVGRIKQLAVRYAQAQMAGTENEWKLRETISGDRNQSSLLVFVSTLCAVFQYDTSNDNFRSLRRKMLGVIHVGEFDPNAEAPANTASLVLPDVVCQWCQDVVDIDLCDPPEPHVFAWSCRSCHHELDHVLLEDRIVQQLLAALTSYQLQDLRCSKCHRVRPDNMSTYCSCSGTYECVATPSHLEKSISIFRHVAAHFGLRQLRSVLETYA